MALVTSDGAPRASSSWPSATVRAAASLEVRTAERSYSAVLPPDSEESLMREELSILGRDPVFDQVLG